MSRDIRKFIHPDMVYTLIQRVKNEYGIDIGISCVDRTFDEQAAYWAQGREPLAFVNKLRAVAGLPSITQEENRRKVTWTWNSKHLTNINDDDPDNDKSRAVDFFVIYNGKAVWDVKADVNKDNASDYEEVCKIAREIGFKCGIDFPGKACDPPHLQVEA